MNDIANGFRIIIVEDDEALLNGLSEAFKLDGAIVVTAKTASEGKKLFQEPGGCQPADIAVLDLNLPDGSGYDVLRLIKKNYPDMPSLILSARSSEIDKVLGLEIGADDFVCKPFSLRELQARIKAIMRRSGPKKVDGPEKDIFKFEGLELNFSSRELLISGSPVKLSFTEFQILRILVINKNMVVERETLLEKIWSGVYIDVRSLDPHISRLRRKISPYGALIETIPNVGYKFKI